MLDKLDSIKKEKVKKDQKNPKLFLPFTKQNFVDAITYPYPNLSREKVLRSATFQYLLNYFHCDQDIKKNSGKLKANSILIESNYFSESFLSNLPYYNTSSSPHITKTNTRIHFFGYDHSDNFFDDAFIKNDKKKKKDIWNSYYGYVTIRPLSGAIFGACFLRPYDKHNFDEDSESPPERSFNSVIESFRFDIYGKKVSLDGLPFQAQDISVGSCATYAIWMALFKLNKLFKSKLLSPYDITKSAGISTTDVKRMYPSVGMDARQIMTVIRSADLTAFNIGRTKQRTGACECCEELIHEIKEHFLEDHGFDKDRISQLPKPNEYFHSEDIDLNTFKRLIYAYNKMGIPILLTYSFINWAPDKSHLVAISGFKTNINKVRNTGSTKYLSDKISTIYAHNDNHGPYEKFVPDFDNENGLVLRSFKYSDGAKDPLNVKPELFFAPVDASIKISAELIFKAVNVYDQFIMNLFSKIEFYNKKIKIQDFEWEVYLDYAINYKQEFFGRVATNSYEEKVKEKILFTNFPKFVWVARFIRKNKGSQLEKRKADTFFDIIYDATSLPTENCVFQVNYLDEQFGIDFVNCLENFIANVTPQQRHFLDEERVSFFKDSVIT